jgi:ATP-dependent HslUV protease ATP-binding subunit HslU
MAAQVNRTVENIGARRLHTVMERIMEEISFDAGNHLAEGEDSSEDAPANKTVTVTKELVQERLGDLVVHESELKKYIL